MEGIISALAKLLPVITGKIVSPVPTAVLVLLLIGPRGRRNGLGYLSGWFLGTLAVGIALLVSGAGLQPSHHAWFQKGSKILHLCFGLLFLVLAAKNIKKWQREEQSSIINPPEWLGRIEQFTFWRALILGVGLGTLGAPKNTTLVLQALITIMRTDLGTTGQVIVFFIFDALGSIIMLTLFAAYLLLGARSEQFLEKLKDFLVRHDNTILLVLFILLGGYFLAKGIRTFL